jgi:hypothetical protein
MKNLFRLLAAAGLTAAVSAQAGTTTYNWTETGSSFGSGSGTLTVDTTSDQGLDGVDSSASFNGSGYDFTIVSATGLFNGEPISVPSGNVYFFGTFGAINFSTNTAPSTAVQSQVLNFDMVWSSDGQTY